VIGILSLLNPVYIIMKAQAARRTAQYVLWQVLDNILRLLHPFMPFITEEIWQHLPHQGTSICVAPWPVQNSEAIAAQMEAEMELIMAVIRGVRNIRAEMNIAPGKKAQVIVQCPQDLQGQLEQGIDYIKQLAGANRVVLQGMGAAKPRQAATAIVGGVEIFVPLEGLVDIDLEIARLQKELQEVEKEVDQVVKKLQNEKFLAKAPEPVVAKERQKEQEYREKQAKLEERLAMLQGQ
jgi:valyl-tRNA synthetase